MINLNQRDILTTRSVHVLELNVTYDINHLFVELFFTLLTSPESQNAAQRSSHRLSRCQNVLTKIPFYSSFSSDKLRFVIIQGFFRTQFEFLTFVTI